MADSQIFSQKPSDGDPWDIIIIGSGPSAFTAAIYTTRGAASTLILGGEKWGGQLMLTTEVDNFPGHPGVQGPDLMQKMRDHALLFGGELIEKNVESVDFSKHPFSLIADGITYRAKSVIVATGADTKWLGVPGEDKLRGRGVSSCAPCDAPFFKDKKVIVAGGGDSAMEEALVLTKYASSVTVIHRRDEFKASHAMQTKVLNHEKIDIVWDTEIVEIEGDTSVSGLKLKTNPESKHLAEIKDTVIPKHEATITSESEGINWTMPADGLFVAIGHSPSTDIFKGTIELDQKGYVAKHTRDGYDMSTSVDGVFVAGDVHDYHYRQAITAAGFGCKAGMDTLRYLEEKKD